MRSAIMAFACEVILCSLIACSDDKDGCELVPPSSIVQVGDMSLGVCLTEVQEAVTAFVGDEQLMQEWLANSFTMIRDDASGFRFAHLVGGEVELSGVGILRSVQELTLTATDFKFYWELNNGEGVKTPILVAARKAVLSFSIWATFVGGNELEFYIGSLISDCDFKDVCTCTATPLYPPNLVGGATPLGGLSRCDDNPPYQVELTEESKEMCHSLNVVNSATAELNGVMLDLLNHRLLMGLRDLLSERLAQEFGGMATVVEKNDGATSTVRLRLEDGWLSALADVCDGSRLLRRVAAQQ